MIEVVAHNVMMIRNDTATEFVSTDTIPSPPGRVLGVSVENFGTVGKDTAVATVVVTYEREDTE